MASTIQLKTGTGSAVPSSLTQGEVAINVDNGLFYYGSGSTNTPKQLESFTNITASNLDISGDVDVDGTLEADAITVGGTALSSVIAGTTVVLAATAVNATNAKVTNDTGDAEHPIVFIDDTSPDGGNESLKGNTNITVNPANAALTLAEITASGNISSSGEIETNTISTVTTTLASDAITNVDTFATSTYNGAIYDYILKDNTVGARAGQFMVAHDDGDVTFTDTSTKHLSDSTIPEITADINSGNVRVRVTNGNGYTFKSFVKKL